MGAPQHIYRLVVARAGMLTQGPTPEERRVVGEHVEYLERGAAEGLVLVFGRTQVNDERTFGIALLAIADEGVARKYMENDPAVKGGVKRAELFPFKVAGGCWVK